MKYALFLLVSSIASAQFFPFPGPARQGSGGGGGGSATFKALSETTASAGATTIATPGTLNVAAGDLIVVLATGSFSITGVTCGSDTLTAITNANYDSYFSSLWYKENASANAAATCTASYSSAANFRIIAAANYSGVATSGALDQTSCNAVGCNSQTTSATTRTAQNVTTTQANELLVYALVDWDDHTSHTGGSSFTLRTANTTQNWALLDKNVTSTGTQPNGTVVTVNDAADDRYFAMFATFKAQ